MVLDALKVAAKLEKISGGGLRETELMFNLGEMDREQVDKFLSVNGFVVDPKSLKERSNWYRYTNKWGTELNIDWGSGYAKLSVTE